LRSAFVLFENKFSLSAKKTLTAEVFAIPPKMLIHYF